MALGNNGGANNNNGKIFEPNYYAKTYITNYEKNTTVNVTFGSGLMKVAIANRSADSGKTEEIISASLTGLKAQLLVSAIDQMEKDIEAGVAEGKAYGTSVGMGEVVKAIAFAVENGNKSLIIAKVNTSGTVSEKTVYEFSKDANFYMSWDNFDTMKFAKNYDNEVEFTMLKNTLIDFARNISGAAAYGGLYLNRYEQTRDRNKINAIMDKLGISTRQGGQSYQRAENNFFNSNNGSTGGNRSSEHKTLDEIDSMFSGDDDE